MNCNVRKSVIS